MTTLFSYCIPYNDGAAPNPFWGQCTLVICKPRIRRKAAVGDWVVGTGATGSSGGVNSVVYAMRVSRKMTMREYDGFTRKELPDKIPDWKNKDHRRRLGDSIYDFSQDPPRQREGVHLHENMATDLSGSNALLSDHFYYFGDNPIDLPEALTHIVKHGQGHRSRLNDGYVGPFIEWIHNLGNKPSSLHGNPQLNLFINEETIASCAHGRRKQAEEDEALSDEGD